MFGKKKTNLEKAQDAAIHAIEQVQDALRNLPVEDWQDKLHEIKDSAADVAERTRSNVSDHAHAAADRAREVADHQDLSGKKDAIQNTISGASKLVASRLRHNSDDAVETAQQALDERLHPQDSGLPKWIWLGAGMALGGIIALVLAPASGRRSRAMLRDKLSQGKQQAAELGKTAGETMSHKVAEVSDKVAEAKEQVTERVEDAKHDAKDKSAEVQADMKATIEDDDETIADRVRTELGQNEATRDLERVNVTSCDGVVTLHGPKLKADQKKKVAEVVQAVAGVKEVKNELDAGKEKSA